MRGAAAAILAALALLAAGCTDTTSTIPAPTLPPEPTPIPTPTLPPEAAPFAAGCALVGGEIRYAGGPRGEAAWFARSMDPRWQGPAYQHSFACYKSYGPGWFNDGMVLLTPDGALDLVEVGKAGAACAAVKTVWPLADANFHPETGICEGRWRDASASTSPTP